MRRANRSTWSRSRIRCRSARKRFQMWSARISPLSNIRDAAFQSFEHPVPDEEDAARDERGDAERVPVRRLVVKDSAAVSVDDDGKRVDDFVDRSDRRRDVLKAVGDRRREQADLEE